MARRRVTHARKHNGRVVALGNPEDWWSPRSIVDAIVDIDTGLHRYYVTDTNGHVVIIQTIAEPTGPQLHAPRHYGGDLLSQLPEC